eukprot:gene11293-12474_t
MDRLPGSCKVSNLPNKIVAASLHQHSDIACQPRTQPPSNARQKSRATEIRKPQPSMKFKSQINHRVMEERIEIAPLQQMANVYNLSLTYSASGPLSQIHSGCVPVASICHQLCTFPWREQMTSIEVSRRFLKFQESVSPLSTDFIADCCIYCRLVYLLGRTNSNCLHQYPRRHSSRFLVALVKSPHPTQLLTTCRFIHQKFSE